MLAGWVLLAGVLVTCLGVNACFHSTLLLITPTDSVAWTVWLMLGIIGAQPLTIAAGTIQLKIDPLSRAAFALALMVLCLSALALGSMAALSTASLSVPLHVTGSYGGLAGWLWLFAMSLATVKLLSQLASLFRRRRGLSNEGQAKIQEECLLNWRNHQVSIGGLILFTGILAAALMLTLAAIQEGRATRHLPVFLVCVVLCQALLALLLRPLCYAIAEESNWFRSLAIPPLWFFAILTLVHATVHWSRSAHFEPLESNGKWKDVQVVSQASESLSLGVQILGSPGHLGATMLLVGACLVPSGAAIALRLIANKCPESKVP